LGDRKDRYNNTNPRRSPKARKTSNDKFKTAAKLVTEQGYSTREAALSLGVDQGSIRGRGRQFAPTVPTPANDASVGDIHRENTGFESTTGLATGDPASATIRSRSRPTALRGDTAVACL